MLGKYGYGGEFLKFYYVDILQFVVNVTQNCYIEINSTRYTCLYFITKTENACIYCELVLHDNYNRVSALNVFISVKRSVVSDEK